MNRKIINSQKTNYGFTLIEMLVVVAIMATLMALIAPRFIERAEEAKVTATVAQLQQISTALDMYKLDNSTYPTIDQGLQALVEKPFGSPEPKNWKHYLNEVPLDAWKNEIYYVYPGEHGVYDLYSLGADGQQGGEGSNADIGNWTQN
ncbi:MAG: type II secretion system major pseudopilin GspG [Gammaproteobacteria bacterium]|nr:type II secretion system major pseudopilin GspG [Gammaproteobacteria bacterium]NNC97371.1 type II secretion system major pseudopilin GspG [Gammaproteobacteria bacterium]NNM13110.1 type II secretion system major pseudopilin GspG [Gammaproteobacteria bacterium]